MSNDLVKRLRSEDPETGLRWSLASEAADRIEKLEKALKFMVECEKFTQVLAEIEGKPYTNLGLQFARDLLEREA